MFQGQEATVFWVRAVGLQETMEEARLRISEKIERRQRSIPIVAEHEVSIRLKWIYIGVVQVDERGIQDGTGVVFTRIRCTSTRSLRYSICKSTVTRVA
jgi:hypothetical protein